VVVDLLPPPVFVIKVHLFIGCIKTQKVREELMRSLYNNAGFADKVVKCTVSTRSKGVPGEFEAKRSDTVCD